MTCVSRMIVVAMACATCSFGVRVGDDAATTAAPAAPAVAETTAVATTVAAAAAAAAAPSATSAAPLSATTVAVAGAEAAGAAAVATTVAADAGTTAAGTATVVGAVTAAAAATTNAATVAVVSDAAATTMPGSALGAAAPAAVEDAVAEKAEGLEAAGHYKAAGTAVDAAATPDTAKAEGLPWPFGTSIAPEVLAASATAVPTQETPGTTPLAAIPAIDPAAVGTMPPGITSAKGNGAVTSPVDLAVAGSHSSAEKAGKSAASRSGSIGAVLAACVLVNLGKVYVL